MKKDSMRMLDIELSPIHDKELPSLQGGGFWDMSKLDEMTNQAIHGEKGGLRGPIADTVDQGDKRFEIPENFGVLDPRTSPEEWVSNRLTETIEELFTNRFAHEQHLTKNELKALDRYLTNHLDKTEIINKILHKMEAEHGVITEIGAEMEKTKFQEEKERMEVKMLKKNNSKMSELMKNKDAPFKIIAFEIMRGKRYEKTREIDSDDQRSFEKFYQDILQHDVYKDPRPINEEEYYMKDIYSQKAQQKQIQFENSLPKTFEDQMALYKENKKSDIDRKQVYYILENMHTHMLNNPDPLDKAQESLKQYFSSENNIAFFESNKLK